MAITANLNFVRVGLAKSLAGILAGGCRFGSPPESSQQLRQLQDLYSSTTAAAAAAADPGEAEVLAQLPGGTLSTSFTCRSPSRLLRRCGQRTSVEPAPGTTCDHFMNVFLLKKCLCCHCSLNVSRMSYCKTH